MDSHKQESLLKRIIRFLLFNLLNYVSILVKNKKKTLPIITKGVSSKTILIIELAQMGDALLSTALLKSIRKTFPDSYISLICTPAAAIIIQTSTLCDEVISYAAFWEDRSTDNKPRLKHLKESLILLNILRQKQFDLCFAVTCRPQPFVSFWAYLSRSPVRIGFAYGMGDGFLTHTIVPDGRHMVHEKLALLKEVFNETVTEDKIHYSITKQSYTAIQKFLRSSPTAKAGRYICVTPSTSQDFKLWDVDSWVSLINIVTKNNIAVFIGGGSTDYFYTKVIYNKVVDKNLCKNVTGTLSINEFTALLSQAMGLVTLDSLAMHLSSAVDTPCVALFSRAYKFHQLKPLQNKSEILTKEMECAGCVKGCNNPICMGFTIKEVFEALNKLISINNITGKSIGTGQLPPHFI